MHCESLMTFNYVLHPFENVRVSRAEADAALAAGPQGAPSGVELERAERAQIAFAEDFLKVHPDERIAGWLDAKNPRSATRTNAILALPRPSGNDALAMSIAHGTDLTIEQAAAILGAGGSRMPVQSSPASSVKPATDFDRGAAIAKRFAVGTAPLTPAATPPVTTKHPTTPGPSQGAALFAGSAASLPTARPAPTPTADFARGVAIAKRFGMTGARS